MADRAAGTETLRLKEEFPPVSTEEWESVIQKDLKSADYEKKLVWRTEEGVAVRPYYRREALEPLTNQIETVPGQFPFVRGDGHAWQIAQEWAPPAGAIRGDHFHEAGGTSVQELAFALAEGVERLAKLTEDGKCVDEAAASLDFVFATGSNYFFEIAKLRAARLLWAEAVAAFGLRNESARLMRIHSRTGRINKSVYDPYTNLLRVTTEAMSAAIGGCESLSVERFGFDEHLAANVQRILKEEAHLGAVADPAGGSYYIETLTDALAREAWKLFQEVETEGGYSKALAGGFIEKGLAQSRAAKQKAVASRRRTLLGVNNYPDLKEKEPQATPPAPEKNDPLPQVRLAEPFERIRERTARHARRVGRYPKVLLLKRGDVKMRTARANFSLNFFGCAGFDILESGELLPAVDLVVLCSSDPEYVPLASEICPKPTGPVIVAGNPKEQVEELKRLGVQGFVHVMSDAVETLTHWQNRLGMEE